MNKAQTNKMIKDQVVNILFNTKGIISLYKEEITMKHTLLKYDKWQTGINIKWINPKSVDISVSVSISYDITLAVSYNLINNLLQNSFTKIPKVKLNKFILNVIDIEKGK